MKPIKEFTYKGYRSLLETALGSGYTFVNFAEAQKAQQHRFCILRHDIDADLNAAYEMARIESELNIKSTYFLMLRSPVYNLFSRANHTLTKKIMNLGHHIGIHYDEGFYADETDLNELLSSETAVFRNMFGIDIDVVSFHQPGPRIISNEIKVKGLINTYDKENMKGITYISDSNKIWKEDDAWEIFSNSKHSKLHLLIHPMWWMTDQDLSTEEIWSRVIARHFKREEKQICETERAYGREREIIIRPFPKN
jgi:hypothetical protein